MAENSDQPSAFERARHEHEELRLIVGQAHRLLADPAESVERLAETLDMVKSHVQEHFRDEESSGMFEALVSKSPRLNDRATDLLAQHQRLMAELTAVMEKSREVDRSDAWRKQLTEKFHEFSKALMTHEREENELLQEAYDVDIGSQD